MVLEKHNELLDLGFTYFKEEAKDMTLYTHNKLNINILIIISICVLVIKTVKC